MKCTLATTNKFNRSLEDQCIDFAAERLGYGLLTKNEESREAEHFKGTPDIVLPDAIIDVKTAWNRKTFLDAAQDANKDYEWQVRVYMALFDKPHAIVFHALLDTPEELGGYVFSNLPPEQRWVAYKYTRDFAIEAQMIERAKMADAYLNEYSKSITTKLGKICIQ